MKTTTRSIIFFSIFIFILGLMSLSIYLSYKDSSQRQILISHILSRYELDSIKISNLECELDYWKKSYYDCKVAYEKTRDDTVCIPKLSASHHIHGHLPGHLKIFFKINKIKKS